jgi:hypothetical protein
VPSGAPSSVLASRLASEPAGPLPTFDQLGLSAAKAAGFDWQQMRGRASWNELVSINRGRHPDWVPEIHGILGAVGEHVLVAIEAEVEKEVLVEHLAVPNESHGLIASRSRALRFFAEGQGNALVVAGHGIANLALRTLALHPAFLVLFKGLRIKPADFVPQSQAASAWLWLTKTTADSLLAATAGPPACPIQLASFAQLVVDLKEDPAFSALVALRNVHYHRWRGESPGVTGVNFRGATALERLGRGEAVGIGRELLPAYTEGEAELDGLVRTSRGALDALVARMPELLRAWHEAFVATLKPL